MFTLLDFHLTAPLEVKLVSYIGVALVDSLGVKIAGPLSPLLFRLTHHDDGYLIGKSFGFSIEGMGLWRDASLGY